MPSALATKPGVPDLSLLEIGVSTDSHSSTKADLALDHIGLIVPDLATGRDFLTTTLGITRWTPITNDPVLHVSVQFGAAPGHPLTYELIAPFGDQSPIASALRTGKNILNHLAYLTPNLETSGDHLRQSGCYPVGDPLPALAYQGRRVQFWISPLRFIIELIEKPGHVHPFAEDLSPESQP
jgi:methylmalonyl-CoA/ethylmalonyl-CoA epimerase